MVRTIDPQARRTPAALLIQFLTAFWCCCGRFAYFAVESGSPLLKFFCRDCRANVESRKGTSWGKHPARFPDGRWRLGFQPDLSPAPFIWRGIDVGRAGRTFNKSQAVKEKMAELWTIRKWKPMAGIADKRCSFRNSEIHISLPHDGRRWNCWIRLARTLGTGRHILKLA